MLSILNQPDQMLRGLVLSKPEGVQEKKREGNILAVNPRLGSYSVFTEPYSSFYRRLTRPMPYMDFITNDQGIPSAMYVAFMEEAFSRGLLAISGRVINQLEIPHRTVDNPKIVILSFNKNPDALEFFRPAIDKFMDAGIDSRIVIWLEGNVSPFYDRLPDFIREIKNGFSEKGKFADVILEPGDLSSFEKMRKMPRDHSLSISLAVRINNETGPLTPDNPTAAVASELSKLGIPIAVTGIFSNPEQMVPAVDLLVEQGIVNIGVKIDPAVYMGETSVSAQLRIMEAFARATLEIADRQYENLFSSVKKLFLMDTQRFIQRIVRPNIIHPCGRRPCGMGDQSIIIDDRGNIRACRSAGEATEKLLLINRVGEKPPLNDPMEFWKDRSKAGLRCSRCMWEFYCGGGCPVLKMEKYGSLEREDPRCRYFQILIEELIWKMHKRPGLAAKIGGLF